MGAAISLLVIVLIIAFVLFFGLANILGLIITLIIAGLVGWFADLIIPGRIPFGWIGAIATGLLGAWLGTALLGTFGPAIAGIAIIPAIIGALILAFLFELIFGYSQRTTV